VPVTQRTVRVDVELDGIADLASLEQAALDFARRAPGELIGATVQTLTCELFDGVIGPFGLPLGDDEQPEAPWSCTGCGSRRGFRRRGQRPGGRTLTSAAGKVCLAAWQVACRSCGRRFVPVLELLGLTPTSAGRRLSASWRQGWRSRSPTRRPPVCSRSSPASTSRRAPSAARPCPSAPERLGPEETAVPVLLLDGTGVRAGDKKLGVELHLAVGLVSRRREGAGSWSRPACSVRRWARGGRRWDSSSKGCARDSSS